MIDVFYCTCVINTQVRHWPMPRSQETIRGKMSELCYRRWLEEWQRMYVIRPEDDARLFQRNRRIVADENAESEIYVCTDDDCLLEKDPVVLKALEVMGRHPEFGILSLWPVNANIVEWTPEGYTTANDDDVMEHVSVGGVRFCRKGVVKEWPEITGNSYDTEHCQAIRNAGFRVGYFRNIKMTHLGEGYGTLCQ